MVGVVALAAACQGNFGATPTISLEEAKQVTAKLRTLGEGAATCANQFLLSEADIRDITQELEPGSRRGFLSRQAKRQFYRGNYQLSVSLMEERSTITPVLDGSIPKLYFRPNSAL